MRVKTIGSILTTWLLVTAISASPAGAQQNGEAEVMLQAAMQKEQVEGQLELAIELYQAIVQQHGNNHAVAARALFYLGRSYEKLGNAEARNAYARLLEDYGDQREMAAEARTRLAAITATEVAASRAAAESGTRPVARMLLSTRDEDLNSFFMMQPSPDGRHVAYSAIGSDIALVVRDLATGDVTRLTTSGEWGLSPIWSPDGRRIAYTSSNANSQQRLLKIVDIDSRVTSVPPKVDALSLQPLDWSTDGAYLLCNLTRPDQGQSLAILTLKTGDIVPLVTRAWQANTGAFSPDGRWVAFVGVEDGSQDIYVVAVDGAVKHQITRGGGNGAPLWSPDGRTIVYKNDDGAWAIAVADGRALGTASLISSTGFDQPVSWTAEGRFNYVAYNRVVRQYQVPVDVETGKMVGRPIPLGVDLPGSSGRFAWSPDMKRIAFSERYTGIHVYSVEDGSLRFFPRDLNRQGPAQMWWSGDGRKLLTVPYGAGLSKAIHALDLEDGTSRALFPGIRPAERFHLTADGSQMIYYKGERRPPQRQLVLSATGDPNGLVLAVEPDPDGILSNWVRPKFSPDGSQVLFGRSRQTDHSLWLVSIDGSNLRKLVSSNFIRDAFWDPTGRYIAHNGGSPGSKSVIEVQTGATHDILLPPDLIRQGPPRPQAWSPDGKWIGFVAEEFNPALWTIENLLADIRAPTDSR